MPQLTERCDLWRMVGAYDAGKTMQALITRLPCLRVPISRFDQIAATLAARSRAGSETFRAEGRESTDIFLLPDWVPVQTEDELRRGRFTDRSGNPEQYRYTVAGVLDYEGFGYQDTLAVFCQAIR